MRVATFDVVDPVTDKHDNMRTREGDSIPFLAADAPGAAKRVVSECTITAILPTSVRLTVVIQHVANPHTDDVLLFIGDTLDLTADRALVGRLVLESIEDTP